MHFVRQTQDYILSEHKKNEKCILHSSQHNLYITKSNRKNTLKDFTQNVKTL